MPPDVFVDSQRVNALEPSRVPVFQGGQGCDVVSDGVPVHAEFPGDGGDGDILLFHHVEGPVARTGSEFFPWADAGMFLGAVYLGAGAFPAAEDPFAPVQHHRFSVDGASWIGTLRLACDFAWAPQVRHPATSSGVSTRTTTFRGSLRSVATTCISSIFKKESAGSHHGPGPHESTTKPASGSGTVSGWGFCWPAGSMQEALE